MTTDGVLLDEREVELVVRVRAGDQEACAALVRGHADSMLAVARRFLRCEADCADVVQEAFVSEFGSIDAYEGAARLGTWLHRIVVNTALMKLRARSRRRVVPQADLRPLGDDGGAVEPAVWDEPVGERLERAETRARVRACIDRLPEPYRTVLVLRDIEEFDTHQTADILDISIPAVKTRLHRARLALRDLLEPMFGPEAGQPAAGLSA
jgi:RNA polymerase sigma-70 factor (ECF subfamily)